MASPYSGTSEIVREQNIVTVTEVIYRFVNARYDSQDYSKEMTYIFPLIIIRFIEQFLITKENYLLTDKIGVICDGLNQYFFIYLKIF